MEGGREESNGYYLIGYKEDEKILFLHVDGLLFELVCYILI